MLRSEEVTVMTHLLLHHDAISEMLAPEHSLSERFSPVLAPLRKIEALLFMAAAQDVSSQGERKIVGGDIVAKEDTGSRRERARERKVD